MLRRVMYGAILSVSSLSVGSVSAWVNTPEVFYDWELVTDLQLSTGFREDDLHWSIADPSGTPNILAELQWKNIQSWEVRADANFMLADLFYLRGSADYGWIFKGNNQDSDFAGDGRTLEFSRSTATSNKGEVFDFSVALGLQMGFCLPQTFLGFCLPETFISFIPVGGYAYSELHFRDSSGSLEINSAFSPLGDELPLGGLGSFPGLHSNYRAKWKGPFAGFDISFPVWSGLKFYGTYEYHWLSYNGTAHWNLRRDIIGDIEQQTGHGHGYLVIVGIRKDWLCNTYFGLKGTYTHMNSLSGTETTTFALGPVSTRFNGALWRSWSILADIGISF